MQKKHPMGLNKNRTFKSYKSTRKGWGKRYSSKANKEQALEEIELDKRLMDLLDLKDEYEIPRIYTRLIREKWTLYDILRILLEGFIVDNSNIMKYLSLTKSEENEPSYPNKYRELDEKDIEVREELRKMFDYEYLSKEEKESLFDLIEQEMDN